jgi:hypothetical protein
LKTPSRRHAVRRHLFLLRRVRLSCHSASLRRDRDENISAPCSQRPPSMVKHAARLWVIANTPGVGHGASAPRRGIRSKRRMRQYREQPVVRAMRERLGTGNEVAVALLISNLEGTPAKAASIRSSAVPAERMSMGWCEPCGNTMLRTRLSAVRVSMSPAPRRTRWSSLR